MLTRWGTLGAVVLVVAIVGAGCRDEAAEGLQQCQEAETRGDVETAWTACRTAAERGSSIAKEKVPGLKLAVETRQAEAKAKAAKEAEERRQAEQTAQVTRLAALKKKVITRWWGFEPDGECQAKGLPAFRVTFEGGTYDENEAVALGDGCRHAFGPHMNPISIDNEFCCPGR